MDNQKLNPMFLIAVPQLGDPNFARSVVLMLHHNEEGALGLIVNSPTQMTLGTFARAEGFTCHPDLEMRPVFRGGPVDPERGWILHQDETVKERQEILPGFFVSGSRETLGGLLEKGAHFRLLTGYAGWTEGQVEEEMKQGGWIAAKVSPKYVFETNPSETWDLILNDMGVDPTQLMVGTGLH
ncbi:MAG: YqgE/AlgH family protein [Deltaproteobacteria bacterium]|nr:YqgE/AlgH family protein [Deltaproteobacteria bacterium]